jgi:hypothetical protein
LRALGEVADIDTMGRLAASFAWLRMAEHHAPERLEPRAK